MKSTDPIKKCWAESYCTKLNAERTNCIAICSGYQLLNIQYQEAEMPRKYQYMQDNILVAETEDEQMYYKWLHKWKDNVLENVEEGKSIWISSPTAGNGKTSWSCNIMGEYFQQLARNLEMSNRGLFVSAFDLAQRLKVSFKDDAIMQEVQSKIERMRDIELLILDDMFVTTYTDYLYDTFAEIIHHRYHMGKSTICTSNKHPEDLFNENLMDERLYSRITDMFDVIEFDGRCRRRGLNE